MIIKACIFYIQINNFIDHYYILAIIIFYSFFNFYIINNNLYQSMIYLTNFYIIKYVSNIIIISHTYIKFILIFISLITSKIIFVYIR